MKKNCFLLLLLFISISSFSQIVKYINLADGTIKITEPIEAGKDITIKILNRSPLNTYEVIINKKSNDIPPLDYPNAVKAAVVSDCQELEKLYDEILKEASELKIAELKLKLDELIKKTDGSCAARSKAMLLRQKIDVQYDIGSLNKGETLEITVKRITSPSKEWTANYSTGSKGVWKTTYGFAFAPTWFYKEEKYYLDGTNKITPERNKKGIDYIPAIFFNWFPAADASKDFSLGFSGGIGVSFNIEPALFLGWALTYNHNISVNVGFAAYRMSYLKGRYQPGDVIAENNFDEESGLHQKIFKVNPFIGLAFRFGSNPFKTDD